MARVVTYLRRRRPLKRMAKAATLQVAVIVKAPKQKGAAIATPIRRPEEADLQVTRVRDAGPHGSGG